MDANRAKDLTIPDTSLPRDGEEKEARSLQGGGGHVKGINRRSFHHHPPPVPADVSWTDGHAANAMKGRGKHLHNC